MTEKAQQSPARQESARTEKLRRSALAAPAYSPATSELLALHDDIGNLAVNRLLDAHERVPVGSADSQHETLADQMAMEGTRGADPKASDAIPTQEWSLSASTASAFGRAMAMDGESLSGAPRRKMEEQFGRPFGDVRLHHDSPADEVTDAFDARALTVGRHIFFSSSASRFDDALLSHELTHVLQQERQAHPLVQRKPNNGDPPVSAKKKRKILAVVFYRNSDVVTLELDTGESISLKTEYNGKPEPGIYALTQTDGEFKSIPVIPGTQNKIGFVVQWTMPEDVTFTGVDSYTFTVVDDQPGEITAPPVSGAEAAAQGVGNNSERSQTNTQQNANAPETLPIPEDIIEMVGGAEQLSQHDPELLHRVLTELMLLTPREREIFRQMATRTTNDLEELERSIRQFVMFHLDTQQKAKRVMERVEEGRWNVDSIMEDWSDQEMLQLDPEDRLAIISSIAGGSFVLNTDERTLIRLLTNIAPSDTPELMAGLKKDKGRLLKRLVKVIDGSQYQEFLHKLRPLFLASLTPGQAIAEMESAAELPWSDPGLIQAITKVRIYYEEVELTDKGTLRIKAWINRGPFGMPAQPIEIDPFAMIAVRFLHDEPSMGVTEGEVVFMPAFNLLALENKQFKAEMALAADVALLFAGGLGVISAGSKARKVLAALDLALGAADLAIREFQAEIAKTSAGRKFLRVWSAVSTAIQIYSLARVVASAPSAFRNLKDAFTEYKAAAGKTVDQTQLARVESRVDDVLQEAETAQRKLAESAASGGQAAPGSTTTAGGAAQQGQRGATADVEGVAFHPATADPEVVRRRTGAPAPEEIVTAPGQKRAVGKERDPDFAEGITREEFGAAQGKIDDAVRTRENRFRQRSPEEIERAKLEQSRPDPKTEQKAKVRESHDAGVEGGRTQAAREGIQIEEWNTPQKWIPEFGRGIDDIGRRNRKVIVVEHKGGTSGLDADQMSNAWVGRKIAQLEVLNDPMAQTLLDAVQSRNLQGVVYTTQLERTALNTQRMSGKQLSRLPDTAVSSSGLIQYAPTKVMQAYRAELARLRQAIERGDLKGLRNL